MPKKPVSIVASGHTRFGKLQDHTLEDLIVEATREALRDANLPASEIDSVFVGHYNSGLVPDGFPASLVFEADAGLRFKPATRCENACASGSAAIRAGINAIRSGEAELVLVVGAEKMTSNSTSEVTAALGKAGYQHAPVEAALSFPQLFALATQQYQQRYRNPLPAMAGIAAKNHTHALQNPLAQMHKAFSVDQCNTVSDANPLIAPPLRLTDCSLVSDGAAAVVLASDDRARDFRRRATIESSTHVNDFLPFSKRDLLAFEGPTLAIRNALAEAGISLADVDFAEVHDCFTIAELLIYEAMGLAPRGEGHRVIEEGLVHAGGVLPVNLSGGLKAKGHPIGATGVSMHALAFRQLIGRAVGIAAERPQFGLVFNMGGIAVANYATVLKAYGA